MDSPVFYIEVWGAKQAESRRIHVRIWKLPSSVLPRTIGGDSGYSAGLTQGGWVEGNGALLWTESGRTSVRNVALRVECREQYSLNL